VLIHLDSWKVAMEVGILLGTCNNAPAEWISPENGWLYILKFIIKIIYLYVTLSLNTFFEKLKIENKERSRRIWLPINLFQNHWSEYENIHEEAISANLGCSSNYSSETLEDRRRKGFQGNCIWPWVSRFWGGILKDIFRFLLL